MKLLRECRRAKRTYSIHKRRFGVSEREIRERAELGDALCLLMLLWSEDELDEADDDEIMLFLAAFGYEKLYKWQDGDVDPLVRQLLDIDTSSPQLLRESCRFEQHQLIQLRNLLGVLPVYSLSNRCHASGDSMLLLYLKLLGRWSTLVDVERNFIGRHYSIVSRMRKTFGRWLFDNHSWRITDNLDFWISRLHGWNVACNKKHQEEFGSPMPARCANTCCGIDVKFYAVTEPANKVLGAKLYNGYEGCCGIKIESVTGPGGQALWVSPPYPGSHHDMFLLNVGQFNTKFRDAQRRFAHDHNIVNPQLHDAYADKGYVNRDCIVAAHKARRNLHLTQLQENENESMKTAISAFMETKYGRNVQLWGYTDANKTLKLFDGRGKGYGSGNFGVHIVNSFLLDNCLVGFTDAGQTKFYGVKPASCHEFLSYVKP